MLEIRGERGSGKTTALVAVFKNDVAGVLVVKNDAIKQYVISCWPELRNRPIVTCEGLRNFLAGYLPEPRLYLDEIYQCELPSGVYAPVVARCGS